MSYIRVEVSPKGEFTVTRFEDEPEVPFEQQEGNIELSEENPSATIQPEDWKVEFYHKASCEWEMREYKPPTT